MTLYLTLLCGLAGLITFRVLQEKKRREERRRRVLEHLRASLEA